ncbi:RHS repeat domain-containing protein [Paenibacillus sp. 481]|uniref:RHS repeat domain-containing protein n=1 Tax=Paenibacillus sp. 481 TaxID=2835869 RepID=UPI001E6538A3|nr:RHS repeat domain-containing protein [Paenibacillus sp. 481]UHA71889.1 hypothetical protein KIK04_14210 [Paenibacillus sp. 481]
MLLPLLFVWSGVTPQVVAAVNQSIKVTSMNTDYGDMYFNPEFTVQGKNLPKLEYNNITQLSGGGYGYSHFMMVERETGRKIGHYQGDVGITVLPSVNDVIRFKIVNSQNHYTGVLDLYLAPSGSLVDATSAFYVGSYNLSTQEPMPIKVTSIIADYGDMYFNPEFTVQGENLPKLQYNNVTQLPDKGYGYSHFMLVERETGRKIGYYKGDVGIDVLPSVSNTTRFKIRKSLTHYTGVLDLYLAPDGSQVKATSTFYVGSYNLGTKEPMHVKVTSVNANYGDMYFNPEFTVQGENLPKLQYNNQTQLPNGGNGYSHFMMVERETGRKIGYYKGDVGIDVLPSVSDVARFKIRNSKSHYTGVLDLYIAPDGSPVEATSTFYVGSYNLSTQEPMPIKVTSIIAKYGDMYFNPEFTVQGVNLPKLQYNNQTQLPDGGHGYSHFMMVERETGRKIGYYKGDVGIDVLPSVSDVARFKIRNSKSHYTGVLDLYIAPDGSPVEATSTFYVGSYNLSSRELTSIKVTSVTANKGDMHFKPEFSVQGVNLPKLQYNNQTRLPDGGYGYSHFMMVERETGRKIGYYKGDVGIDVLPSVSDVARFKTRNSQIHYAGLLDLYIAPDGSNVEPNPSHYMGVYNLATGKFIAASKYGYRYDENNRLQSHMFTVNNRTFQTHYKYDAQGNLIEQTTEELK